MWTNGLQLAGASAAFPSGPTTNDVFFRTDLGCIFTFDGLKWVTVAPATNACFRARNAATFTPGTDVDTLAVVDTIDFDFGSRYDPTNKRFTAPIAGVYLLGMTGGHTAPLAGNYLAVGVGVNTSTAFSHVFSEMMESSTYATPAPLTSGTKLVSLAANDFVYPIVRENGAVGNRTIAAGSVVFSGHLVRGTT